MTFRFDTEVGPGEPIPVPDPDPRVRRPHWTICGSMRFLPQMLDVAAELSDGGVIVLMPYRVIPRDKQVGAAKARKARLDQLHREKIDESDRVVVVTDQTGYYGESTEAEIAYATRWGKPVMLCARYAGEPAAQNGVVQ